MYQCDELWNNEVSSIIFFFIKYYQVSTKLNLIVLRK